MRWVSDRQSADAREVSALAIIETIVASICAYLLYHWEQATWHIAIAVCLAPLLLLRTDRIVVLSVAMAHQYIDFFARRPVYLQIAVLLSAFPIAIMKMIATVRCLFLHPLETIGEIPHNWQRVILCTDTGAVPEIIYGLEDVPNERQLAILKASRLFGAVKVLTSDIFLRPDSRRSYSEFAYRIYAVIAVTYVAAIVLSPAIIYRFSVKSTALVWSPLLWIVRPVSRITDIKVTMRRILTVNLYKIARIYSAIVILFFVWKVILFIKWTEWHNMYEAWTILQLARPYVVPETIPGWHITSVLNAITAWIFYLVFDYSYKDMEQGTKIPETRLQYFFTWTGLVNNLFAVYGALCTAYITVQVAAKLNIPPLGVKLFPW